MNGVKFRIRDLLAGAVFAVLFYPFIWLAFAVVQPLEQMIIEAKK